MIHIGLVQASFTVGDLAGNVDRMRSFVDAARSKDLDLVVFPELSLTGYPPEDLLLRPGFQQSYMAAVAHFGASVQGVDVVFGHPWLEQDQCFNAASWWRDGKCLGVYRKHALPNYAVFDEQRYFEPGNDVLVQTIADQRVAILICEDLWQPQPLAKASKAGASAAIVLNASPFHQDKSQRRTDVLRARTGEQQLPLAYVNLVGSQDELVFDGRSRLMDADGTSHGEARAFEEHLLTATLQNGRWNPQAWPVEERDATALIYAAVVQGTRDYVHRNGFKSVLVGLSGGIDSALTLAVAVDALGAEHVTAVSLPSAYTSSTSEALAAEQCQTLGVTLKTIAIGDAVSAMERALQPHFKGYQPDLTEENIQARCRGVLLMALSNKTNQLLLTTGNKSEYAVGYATLYGDMCGAFAPLKDCAKTLVYKLSRWRNTQAAGRAEPVPVAVIDRPPTAELRHDQLDSDSLPEYDVLDAIIRLHVEEDQSAQAIIDAGFPPDDVRRVLRLVRLNEYKRRQSAPGVRVTARAFGRDRRYPITHGWRSEET